MSSTSLRAQFLASSDLRPSMDLSFSWMAASFSYFLTLWTTYIVLRTTARSPSSLALRSRSAILRLMMSKWLILKMPGASKMSTSTSLLSALEIEQSLLLVMSSRKTSAKTKRFSWDLASRMKYCWQPRERSEHILIRNSTIARSPPQVQALPWNSSKKPTTILSLQRCRNSSFVLLSSFAFSEIIDFAEFAGYLPASILLSYSFFISDTRCPAVLSFFTIAGIEADYASSFLASDSFFSASFSAGRSTITSTGLSTMTSTGFSMIFSTITSTVFSTITSLGCSGLSASIFSASRTFISTSAWISFRAYSAFLSLLSYRMNSYYCSRYFLSTSSSFSESFLESCSSYLFMFSRSFSSGLALFSGFGSTLGFSGSMGLASTRSSNFPLSNSPWLMKPRVEIHSILLQGLLPVYLKSISRSSETIQLHFSLQFLAQKQYISSWVVIFQPAGIMSSSFLRQLLQLSTSLRSMKSVTSLRPRLAKTKKKFIVSTAQRSSHSCRNLVRLQMGPSRILCVCSSEATMPASIQYYIRYSTRM